MHILIGCEFSGIIREAFAHYGHDTYSCDLLDSEILGQHIKGNVLNILNDDWDLAIFHPPCTHLSVSGARWFSEKSDLQKEAIEFFMSLINAPIPKICVENPVSIMSTHYRKPDQYIHPWEHGHGETKKTALWLKNLPRLQPSNIVDGRNHTIHHMAPSPDRAQNRSRTYTGIAKAMAHQWGTETNVKLSQYFK